MEGLGWKLGEWKADYRAGLPKLSEEELKVVLSSAKRIAERSRGDEAGDEKSARAACEKALVLECEDEGLEIDGQQKEYLSRAIYLRTYGLGFLEGMLSDNALEEIAVVGIGRPAYVYVRGAGWKRTDVALESQEYFVALVNRMGRELGRRLTAQQPRMNAVLPDGSRLHASMPPVSDCELTIRKFGKERFSVFDLLARGTYGCRELSYLSLCLQSDIPVLFCGNTASGKTTSLNAMLCMVPASERMLVIEETPEISLPHPHQVRLLPFEEGKIGMVELVRDSLRMRPDRVVVGEVRGAEEARAFAESALSGQAKGCYATFHAQTARDALLRMRMMGCLEADLEGIGLFVVQRRVSSYDAKKRRMGEGRRMTEMAIANPSDPLRPHILHDGRKFSPSALLRLSEKICEGSNLSPKEVKEEAASREKFFSGARKKKPLGFEKSFEAVQKFLFGGNA